MASSLTWLGRFVFFGLITTQSMFLSAYLAKYEGKSNWYFMAFSLSPAVFAWSLVLRFKSFLRFKSRYLAWLFRIWGLGILAFVVNIAMVLRIVGDRISKTEFLSPNVLKVILCITPLLLLLLLNTGDLDDSHESKKGREIVSKLCFSMAVDLFDGIEMIYIVLEEREYDFGIPKAFSAAMIALASFSFIVLVIPWQMVETKLTEESKNSCPYCNISQYSSNSLRKSTILGYSCGGVLYVWQRRVHLHRHEWHRNSTFQFGNWS